MGETAASNPGLQVSVSFGRFENDSLSWERWSSFSPNKYLEEVEKCATPGSVAQKKAYFEAHYKKIAAQKAELLAQEKQSEKNSSISEFDGICGASAEFDASNSEGSLEVVRPETSSVDEVSRVHVDNLEEEVGFSRDYLSAEGKNEELENKSHSSHQIDKAEEVVCIRHEETLDIEVEDVKEISHVVYKETGNAAEVEAEDLKLECPKEVKTKDLRLDNPKESKVTSGNKESNAAKTKKKPTLATSKASQISTPRSSKPASTPLKASATSASSTKRGNSPSSFRKQITSSGESRKVADKSLHMSMSLGPSNPDPAPHNTMRKSFIMEKMGNKEIVRRAFKTFQNNFNQPNTSVEDRSLVKTQVSSKGTMSKVPTSTALQKENGRCRQNFYSYPSDRRLLEEVDRRSGSAVRSTSGPKREIRAEKGKESPRKIEEKSSTKVVERMQLQPKLKEVKDTGMKKIKHNFKATPLPAFYRGQKASKSHPEKGDAKAENPR